jgi:ornithine cyclodeaminase/alanine dehydrogenase-like protein (mu-crystallin family)
VLILNRAAVEASLGMAACIEAVAEALRAVATGAVEPFARLQLRPADDGPLVGLMPVRSHGPRSFWCTKVVAVAATNPARGLDSHQGAVLLLDGETGVPAALLDAAAITAIRTAAASAVASRLLAAPDSRRVAILGTGRQARSHVEAMRAILPDARIVIWGRDRAAATALAGASGTEPADDPREAVTGADIVCTVTGSRTPILDRSWLKPGCHVNAVGASAPDAREIGGDIIAACELFVDSRAQALTECGEYLIPLREGVIGAEAIRAEIGEVLAGLRPGRSDPAAITVFKSLGLAAEDLAASLAAIDAARANGTARTVAW